MVGERRDRGLKAPADAAPFGGEDGERERAGAHLGEAIDQRQPLAELGALLGDLQGCSGAEPQAQHPDLTRQREHRDSEPEAQEKGDHDPDSKPLLGREASLRQRREDREAGGEEQVAKHRRPADRRARAEACAGGADPATQDRPHQRRGEEREEQSREPARLVAPCSDRGREAELREDERGPGEPAHSLTMELEGGQGGAARSRARELQRR